jgi:hypothetical protein
MPVCGYIVWKATGQVLVGYIKGEVLVRSQTLIENSVLEKIKYSLHVWVV